MSNAKLKRQQAMRANRQRKGKKIICSRIANCNYKRQQQKSAKAARRANKNNNNSHHINNEMAK